MLCDECGKNKATFHSIEKINGVTNERHLCSECQKKYGGSIMKMSGLGSLFGGFVLFGEDEDVGYEYDPKYYDDFGNEIDLPDEFERESVEIRDAEVLEEPPKAASHGTSSSHGKSSPHAAPPQDRHRAKEGNLRRKRRPGRH